MCPEIHDNSEEEIPDRKTSEAADWLSKQNAGFDTPTFWLVSGLLAAFAEAAVREWKNPIIEALIVNHIYTAEHENNPQRALADLIAWEVKVALDPRVSEAANKLVREEREACAKIAEKHRIQDFGDARVIRNIAAAIRERGGSQ